MHLRLTSSDGSGRVSQSLSSRADRAGEAPPDGCLEPFRSQTLKEERMAGKSFKAILESWVGQQVTVINPQSYRKTPLSDGVALETYTATITTVEDDYVSLSFEARKRNQMEKVEQVVPFSEVKRVSTWGGERFLQL